MLSKNALRDLLIADNGSIDEATAITKLVNSYGSYCANAECNEIQISSAAVNAGKSAMSSSLVGMTDLETGNNTIQTAIIAFWNAVALTSDAFVGSTSIIAPSLINLAAKLTTIYSEIYEQQYSLDVIYDKIAIQIHDETSGNESGTGTCNFGGEDFPII